MKKYFGLMILISAMMMLGSCVPITIGVSLETKVNAPVEKVFDIQVNTPENEVTPSAKQSTALQGEGLGSTSETIFDFMGQTMKVKWTTTEYVPNQKVVYKGVGGFVGTATWIFLPDGNGTKVVEVFEVTLDMPIVIPKKLIEKGVTEDMKSEIAAIKKKAEQ